jgi:hypothetical protein
MEEQSKGGLHEQVLRNLEIDITCVFHFSKSDINVFLLLKRTQFPICLVFFSIIIK